MTTALFAHAGHSHELPAAVPWWQDSLAVSAVLVAGFLAMLLAAHFVFKARLDVKITLAMAYLLAVGMLGYSIAPMLSITALAVGFALALFTVSLQLGIKKQPPKK